MFKIGDFARLGQVSVRMLRHYDKLGLLKPSHTDPSSGYRYYTVEQLVRLDVPHSFTYVADFGRTLAALGTREEALGRAWHVPSPAPLTQAALVALLGEELGRPLRARGSGALMLRALGLFNPAVAETVEMLYEWQRPFTMDSGACAHTFGIEPTPLRETLRESLAWVRGEGAALAAHAS